MRARIREPGESLRGFFYGLSAICFSAAVIFRVEIGPPLDPVFFAGAALLFMSPIFRQQTAWRNAEIEAHPGRLEISRRGIFGKRESALAIKNLIGASIARVEGKMNLALAVGSSARHPVVIEFENDADAKLATGSLGIGKNGFGVVVWERAPEIDQRFVLALRVAATFFCLVICVLAKFSDPFAATLDVRSASTIAIVGALAVVMLGPLTFVRRTLSLTSDAAVMFEDRIRTLKYGTIATIRLENSQFVIDRVVGENDARGDLLTARVPFSKRTPFLPGLDDVDTTMIVEHVTAAAERARHGMKTEPHEQARTLLAKRDRETNEQWVRRIDDLAAAWRASPPRYGESVDIKHALWQAVEDHDCDETLRALAARMLAKLDPENAPPRILRVADAIRIPRQASRIRVALETEAEKVAQSIAVKSSR
jgi:hypothetical protein